MPFVSDSFHPDVRREKIGKLRLENLALDKVHCENLRHV